jgi:Kef-type K+ transport system membrane component KefB
MNKLKFKTSVRTALLLYAVIMGISGIIMFSVLLLWVIPEDQIPIVIVPLSAMALFLFGSCVIALILLKKFFRKQETPHDQ